MDPPVKHIALFTRNCIASALWQSGKDTTWGG